MSASSPHISPAIEEAMEIARMVTAAPYEVPMNPGPSTKIARALIDLEEQLQTVQRDYEIAEIGCQQLEGINRELQEQLESMKRAAEWEQEHGGCFCRTCNEAVGASSPASRPPADATPFDKPKMQQIGESLPASDPDGAYWRAQGGVPNQESKP